jgi:adenine/guanine phosphoribosyltransferase-like PRPP-binding protein
MNKFTDFPQQPRIMTADEGERYFDVMLHEIAQFEPDEIVAVARSGFSYAMWVSQILKKPLGVYWPKNNRLHFDSLTPKKVVFVDDNILGGSTYTATKSLMQQDQFKHIEWRWAVLFSDWHTPQVIRDEIIQGVRLNYFAEEPMWGSRKVSQDYGVRFRDE